MAEFRRYVCWDPIGAEAVIAPMVESASEAVFLASHHPLPILPEISTHVGRQESVTEQDVLQEFLSFAREPAILAVIGPPGTGKSHLVKWLNAQLAADPRRLVLYVPREDTSLRVVLNKILGRLPGPEALQLKDDIRAATDKVPPDLATANVLDLIANQLEYSPPVLRRVDDAARRDLIVGSTRTTRSAGLPEILRHPSARRMLLASDGVIARNVRVALNEYRADDGPPPRYEPADSAMFGMASTEGLPREAAQLLALLRLQGPEGDAWRADAAELLNASLDDAISSLLGLNTGVSLTEVMTRAREILHEDGKELVLLIEDLALFERIGAALVDSLVIPSGEGRCTLRTAFAITDDPYQRLPETLRDRVGLRFRMGLPFGTTAGGVDAAQIVGLVGKYLNAVRVGAAQLELAWADADENARATGEWVPNQCSSCAFQQECHSKEGFQHTGDDYGLYPLNRASAERLIAAALQNGRFVPRELLGKVLAPMLGSDAADVEAGKFPGKAFETRAMSLPSRRGIAPVAAELVQSLQEARDPQWERRVRVLRFWRRGSTRTPTDLSDEIHTAFDLPKLGVEVAEEADEGAVVVPTHTAVEAEHPGYAQIDLWLSEEDEGLPTEVSALLRRRLYEMVMGRIRWNDELLAHNIAEVADSGDVLSVESFQIPGAAGGRRPKAGALVFNLERDAETAVVLKAILRAEGTGTFDTARDYCTLSARVSRWSDEVLARLRAPASEGGRFPVEAAIAYLIVSSLVLGLDVAAYQDPTVAALDTFAGPTGRPEPVTLTAGWAALVQQLHQADLEAVRLRCLGWLQAAQGASGDVLGFDAASVIPHADRLLTEMSIPDPPVNCPPALRELGLRLHRQFAPALEAEVAALLEFESTLDWSALSDLRGLVDQTLDAVEVASQNGVYDGEERIGAFKLRCQQMADQDTSQIEALRTATSDLRSPNLALQLRGVAKCAPALAPARAFVLFLRQAEDTLRRSLSQAEYQLARAFPDTTPEAAEEALRQELRAYKELLERMSQVARA